VVKEELAADMEAVAAEAAAEVEHQVPQELQDLQEEEVSEDKEVVADTVEALDVVVLQELPVSK